jgi:tripartite-type tricarboxylate transporter receptor subunit TctC
VAHDYSVLGGGKMMKKFLQSRRNLLRFLGISILAGTLLTGGVGLPLTFAKEVYPAKKITWINADKPGGGADIMARLICSYLPKYLKEVSKEAKGGEIAIKNVPESGGRRAYSNIYNADRSGYLIGDFNNTFVTENIGSKIDEFDYNKFTFLARIGVSLPFCSSIKTGLSPGTR